jgi:hypothetical protein
MDMEIVNRIIPLAHADFEEFVRKTEEVTEKNPELGWDEVDALVEHGPMELPEDLQGYEEEYEYACLAVYYETSVDALLNREEF